MDIKEDKPKCVSCGATLLRSRKFIASKHMYWNRPWGGTLKMSDPVIPYACMGCGRVYLYLRDKNRIIREFCDLPEAEKTKIE